MSGVDHEDLPLADDETSPPGAGCQPADRGVVSNALFLAIAALVVGGTRFGTNWWIARDFGAEEHGRFAVIFQLLSMVAVFGELGIASTYGVRKIAESRATCGGEIGPVINRLAAALVITHVGGLLILLAACMSLETSTRIPITLLAPASVWLIGFGFYRVAMMVTIGFERGDWALGATLVFYAAWIGWLAMGMKWDLDVAALVLGWAWVLPLAGVASCMIVTPLMRCHGVRWQPWSRGGQNVVWLIASAIPYGLPVAGTLAVPGIVCLLLACTNDDVAQISYFQISYSVAILAHLVAMPFATSALARWSRLRGDGNGASTASAAVLDTGLRICGSVALLALGVCAMVGEGLFGWIDAGYAAHASLLIWLAAGVAVDVVRMLLDQFLMASGQVRIVAWSEAARYAVLVGTGILLIPKWGARGAVVAVVASMVVNTVLKALIVSRRLDVRVWYPLGAIAMAGILVALLGSSWHAAVVTGIVTVLLWMMACARPDES